MKTPADVESLTKYISEEIYKAFGLSSNHWLHYLLSPFVRLPAGRFSQVAARFDQDVAQFGFREAARRILPCFARDYQEVGESISQRKGHCWWHPITLVPATRW